MKKFVAKALDIVTRKVANLPAHTDKAIVAVGVAATVAVTVHSARKIRAAVEAAEEQLAPHLESHYSHDEVHEAKFEGEEANAAYVDAYWPVVQLAMRPIQVAAVAHVLYRLYNFIVNWRIDKDIALEGLEMVYLPNGDREIVSPDTRRVWTFIPKKHFWNK